MSLKQSTHGSTFSVFSQTVLLIRFVVVASMPLGRPEQQYLLGTVCSNTLQNQNINSNIGRSEGFPERDIWFLGMLDQGSARCSELLGRRRRRRHLTLPGGAAASPDPP